MRGRSVLSTKRLALLGALLFPIVLVLPACADYGDYTWDRTATVQPPARLILGQSVGLDQVPVMIRNGGTAAGPDEIETLEWKVEGPRSVKPNPYQCTYDYSSSAKAFTARTLAGSQKVGNVAVSDWTPTLAGTYWWSIRVLNKDPVRQNDCTFDVSTEVVTGSTAGSLAASPTTTAPPVAELPDVPSGDVPGTTQPAPEPEQTPLGTVSPTSVGFTGMYYQSPPVSHSVTVTNSGSGSLQVSGSSISAGAAEPGASNPFSISSDGCAGQVLGAGQSCSIVVDAAFVSMPRVLNATLNVSTNAGTLQSALTATYI